MAMCCNMQIVKIYFHWCGRRRAVRVCWWFISLVFPMELQCREWHFEIQGSAFARHAELYDPQCATKRKGITLWFLAFEIASHDYKKMESAKSQ